MSINQMSNDEIAKTIHTLLASRAAESSICPSDVARALVPHDELAWRALMPQIRQVAAALSGQGLLRVTRGDAVVDAKSPGGPIRLRRPRE